VNDHLYWPQTIDNHVYICSLNYENDSLQILSQAHSYSHGYHANPSLGFVMLNC